MIINNGTIIGDFELRPSTYKNGRLRLDLVGNDGNEFTISANPRGSKCEIGHFYAKNDAGVLVLLENAGMIKYLGQGYPAGRFGNIYPYCRFITANPQPNPEQSHTENSF